MTTSTAIIVLVLLLAGNAFFVASEFAMVSARRDQLEPKLPKLQGRQICPQGH
ncbi:CNNM domain-containing protein [Kocuria atrinae]|uniref:CNNM domain-containing protein n=1 Tax=Kocuria atrinae TaxID=592377 RepID=UPI0002E6340A|nr:CNNM domain-containing protein [Kocuria atrinae]